MNLVTHILPYSEKENQWTSSMELFLGLQEGEK